VAYSPDGARLYVGGQQSVASVDAKTGEPQQVTTQPAWQRVTGLSATATTLAVAAGPPGKEGYAALLNPADLGVRPTRAGGHRDSILSLAFDAAGQRLATAGYDRLILLHTLDGSQPPLALKDHSDSVYGVAFSPDGSLLASVAADRAVKVWDSRTGQRLYTLGDATDWVYAVSFSPDGKHLAAAGVDKSLRIWQIDRTGGKLVGTAFAHEKPVIQLAYSRDGQKLVTLSEDRTLKVWNPTTLAEMLHTPTQPEAVLSFALRPDGQQLALGRYDGKLVLLDMADGKELRTISPFAPPKFPLLTEQSPNDSPTTGMLIRVPATVTGVVSQAGDVDWYRFTATAGQEIGVQVVVPMGSTLDPIVQLTDAAGQTVAEGERLLGYTAPTAGTYSLGIRDRDYRGGSALAYRVRVGPIPVVTGVFPLGVARGTRTEVRLLGVNLGAQRTVAVTPPASTAPGTLLPVPVPTLTDEPVLGQPQVMVSTHTESQKPGLLPVPGTGNGTLAEPNAQHTWSFGAEKGVPLIVEVHARRLGTPVDSYLEIVDAKGELVPRATLRCVAKTYTNLRDNDSAQGGIRIEAWNEFAMRDYLLIGTELMRIRELPRNPDDDCQMVQIGGRRAGFLDTTPTHHSFGSTVYKVAIHPPGQTFPPNGMPLFTLNYQNDDGGDGYGKDSRLTFTPPQTGTYTVRVRDARGLGGPGFGYRVTVRPPAPSYTIAFTPSAPSVVAGQAVPITVTATRVDGFEGRIDVQLVDLPPGFRAPPTHIEAEQTTTTFALMAEVLATAPTEQRPLRLKATATIAGQTVEREQVGGVVKLIPPGDILTRTTRSALTIKPGQETKIVVNIERRNEFKGRIPLEVQGLPYGVRVLNVGLNGILITERDTSREIVLYAEPWVQPLTHPFVVLARREGKNTVHAAPSVLLKVEK
jgi:hypothetical protein